MYSKLLFSENDDSPAWWQKWNYDVGTANVFKELAQHGAKFRTTKNGEHNEWGDRYLDFESEEAAVLFFLKVIQ